MDGFYSVDARLVPNIDDNILARKNVDINGPVETKEVGWGSLRVQKDVDMEVCPNSISYVKVYFNANVSLWDKKVSDGILLADT